MLNQENGHKVDIEVVFSTFRLEPSWCDLCVKYVGRSERVDYFSHDPGGGVLPKKLGRGVRPTSQNPYPTGTHVMCPLCTATLHQLDSNGLFVGYLAALNQSSSIFLFLVPPFGSAKFILNFSLISIYVVICILLIVFFQPCFTCPKFTPLPPRSLAWCCRLLASINNGCRIQRYSIVAVALYGHCIPFIQICKVSSRPEALDMCVHF